MCRGRFSLVLLCTFLFNTVESIEIKGFDDTVLFKINWPGRDANEILDFPGAEPLIVTTEHNEQYRCLLPQSQSKEKEPVTLHDGISCKYKYVVVHMADGGEAISLSLWHPVEFDGVLEHLLVGIEFRTVEQQIFLYQDSEESYEGPNPLELLSPVFTPSSTCSYRLESYWTYELCHGRHIRQYHEEREGKKVKQQEFVLGKWDKTQHLKLHEALENSRSSVNIPVKKIEGVNMPYLQVNMTDGTLCDLNEKPRFTRVLYVCYMHGKHEISSLKETSTCEYEVVVFSPHLCKHPKYKPQESGENIISCHPLEGMPKKPKDLLALEAESSKLRQQKIADEKMQQVFAVFSIDRTGEGQDGQAKVRVEIHPVEVSVDTVEPEPPTLSSRSPMMDTSPTRNFLSGKHCLVGGSTWWRYEFCYGTSVDQFHVEKDGTRTVVHLGMFDKAKHLEWLEKNPHKRPKPLPIRKHVSHLYSGGTICDKTGRPRQTEVKLKCAENNVNPTQVSLFMYEPKTCEYVLGVESLLLCDYLPLADDNGFFKLTDDAVELGDEVTVSSEDDDVLQETSSSNEDTKASNKLGNDDL